MMTMFPTLVLLGLVAVAHSLPPPSSLSTSSKPWDISRDETRVDHHLDLLGLSRRLSVAVAPLLDVFLAPIVESLPEDYLDSLADSINKERFSGLGPDQITHNVQYFKDDDKLQVHEDQFNIISRSD